MVGDNHRASIIIEHARTFEKNLNSLVMQVELGDWEIILPTNELLSVRLLHDI